MKDGGFRILLAAAGVAAACVAVPYWQRPISAAQANASAQQNAGNTNQQKPAADREVEPEKTPSAPGSMGAAAYARHCAICHGDQREGILPGFPPLVGIHHRYSDEQIANLVHAGKGRMPGFPHLQGDELHVLMQFLSTEPAHAPAAKSTESSSVAEAGGELFHQNCAFCHGRDAMGGETGPDLTQSKLVLGDKTGEKIAAVVREGRPENKMPGFNFSSTELQSLIAFIRSRQAAAEAHPGARRGVAVTDLQTGNAEAGRQFFEGAGGCSKCHSPTGDLAGIANRYQGLQLEERFLYPRDAKRKASVTPGSGKTISGRLAYLDEFTIGIVDSNGTYHSWPVNSVQYKVDNSVDAHVDLFPKYTDADVHNLMAYLQTLR